MIPGGYPLGSVRKIITRTRWPCHLHLKVSASKEEL
jgi:hypothetical protein